MYYVTVDYLQAGFEFDTFEEAEKKFDYYRTNENYKYAMIDIRTKESPFPLVTWISGKFYKTKES